METGDGVVLDIGDIVDIAGAVEVDNSITATSFIKSGGTSAQFLKADGSVDTNTYLTSGDVTSSQWDAATGGINYAGGNVGIGTSSPDYELEVDGDIRATSEVFWGNNSSSPVGRLYAGAQTGVMLNTENDGAIVLAGGNTTSSGGNISFFGGAHASQANEVRFRSGATNTMLIDSSGNVGIGTTSPNSKLEVNLGTNQNIGFNSDSSVARISSYNDAFSASSPLKINSSELRFDISTIEKMRIDSDGNVGIGTDDPQAKLDVDGGIRMGNDTQTPASTNVGTMRYYADAAGSYVDMIMQTDTSTYAWVNIVRNIFSV